MSTGVPERSESPESRNGRCLVGLFSRPDFGALNGLGNLGLPAVHGFSRPGVPRKSAVARVARRPSTPQHPRRGTASDVWDLNTSSAAQPAAVPRGGRGHKSPAQHPIRCLFPGKAWRHLPQEPTAQPMDTEKRPGTLGAVVSPERMLQTFAKGFSQIVGNTGRE